MCPNMLTQKSYIDKNCHVLYSLLIEYILDVFPDDTFLLASEIHLMFSSKVSLRFKFRVCVRHGAVFRAAVSVDAVVWILVNTQSRFSDPLDNLLLSSVSNEAAEQKNQEEEDED